MREIKLIKIRISVMVFYIFILTMIAAPFVHAAPVTFGLTILDREPAPFPVGRVKITLDTDSDPTGSTLQIGGTPYNFSNFQQPVGTAGDMILFNRVSGMNQVKIEIIPNSNMNTLGDYCTAKTPVHSDPVFPDTWTLTFDGGTANVTGYRRSVYTTPSTVKCGCPQRRVRTGVNWTGSWPGMNNGRHPFDVILVLDESGSMGSIVAGSGGQSKMSLLHSAVNQFIDTWKAEETQVADDRLGVVMFTTSATPLTFGENFFVERGNLSPTDPAHPWDQIKTAVSSRLDKNMTALGLGIQEALDQWNASLKNDASFIIMTNGLQNINPKIIADISDPSLLALNGVPLSSHCSIRMQTVGVGAPATVQADLLDQIAEETGGIVAITAPFAIDAAFTDALLESIRGNTLEMLNRDTGSLAAGQTISSDHAVNFNPTAKQGLLILSWKTQTRALDLEIKDPNNIVIPPVIRLDEDFHTVQTFDIPGSGPAGEWSVKVKRSDSSTGALSEIDYRLTFLAVERAFSYQMNFEKSSYIAGDDIILCVEVNEDGVPVTDLGDGIVVEVNRPRLSLSSYMHLEDVSNSVLNSNPPGFHEDQFPSVSARKLFHFMENNNLRDLIEAKPETQTIRMHDDGEIIHGDVKASDGIYSMKYTETRIPGQYIFKLKIAYGTGDSKILRTENLETDVEVGDPDKGNSEVLATKEASGKYLLTIVPADRFSNFYGPDHGEEIDILINGPGNIDTPITDKRANGTYTTVLSGIPDTAHPEIIVKVRGDEIERAELSELLEPERRYAVFASIGANIPHSDFGDDYDSGVSAQIGFEYRFTNRFSAEGTFGYENFDGKDDNSGLDIYRFSANCKFYPLIGTFQLSIFGGPGIYVLDPGDVQVGLNLGAGAEYRITTDWSLEALYNFNNAFCSGDDARYSTVQGGFKFRF